MSAATPTLLSLVEARQLLAAALAGGRVRSERIGLDDAAGRYLSDPLRADFPLPPVANSAMDGYAVCSLDTGPGPVQLPLHGIAMADGRAPQPLARGTALRIMTGAPLPQGADAVVIQENVRLAEGRVHFEGPVRPGQNVRQAGEDVQQGCTLLPSGTRLGPIELALLASFGHAEIRVRARPRVAVITTGDELLRPGEPRRDTAIYDSNATLLAALVSAAGAQALPPVHLPDDAQLIAEGLRRAAQSADLVVCCGGASVGDGDHVQRTLHRDAHVHFWKVRIKPGMPVLFATLDQTPVLALPGNPVSALLTFLLFGRWAVQLLSGVDPSDPPPLQVALATPLRKSHARREFQRGRLLQCEGRWQVEAGPAQGSHHLSALRAADVLLDLPEGPLDWPAGQMVTVYRLRDWMAGG